jgi:uncharacterized membrane protein YdbT with pleckstrin-like domain
MQFKKFEEKQLYAWQQTRRAYLAEYACGLFLLASLLVLYGRGVVLQSYFAYIVGGVGVGAVLSAEFHRFTTRYRVTNKKFTIIQGIIKQTKKNVYFQPLAFIPDLNMKQSRLERFLGYGTVFVEGGATGTFYVRNVNNPHKVMEQIQQLIDENKS